MTKKIKRIVSILMSILLVLGIMPAGMIVASAEQEGVLMYSQNGKESKVIGCNSSAEGEVVIPEKLGGFPVVEVDLYAFSGCAKVTAVTVPDSVTKIDTSAFKNCTALKSLKIGKGVTSIASNALDGCTSLEKIEVAEDNTVYYSDKDGVLYNEAKTELLLYPIANTAETYTVLSEVTAIADSTFVGSKNVKKIVIGDKVLKIGANAFLGSMSLESVEIGKGVAVIGNVGYDAFQDCAKLKSIVVSADNAVYSSDANGTLYNKAKTQIIKYPENNTKTSVTIPSGVSEIGIYAFAYASNLKEVTIPKTVKNISAFAFYGCANIEKVYYEGSELEWKSINIGSNNNAILGAKIDYAGGEIHDHSYTATVTKQPTCTEAGVRTYTCSCSHSYTEPIAPLGHNFENNTCKNCNIKEFVYITDGTNARVTSYNGSLSAVIIPEKLDTYTVNAIGDSAFENKTFITSIAIPATVKDIGSNAFYNTGYYINSANWTDGVLYIGSFLIQANSSLKPTYVVKDGTTVIADYAFSSRSSLVNITLPKTVVTIGDYAFSGCSSLSSVTTGATEEEWASVVIGANNENLTKNTINFYVPPHEHAYIAQEVPATCTEAGYKLEKCACGDEKKTDYPPLGHDFVNNTCTRCNEREYEISINGGEVTITACHKSLSGTVTLPAQISGYDVTAIAEKTFANNQKITKLVIPATVKFIGNNAFENTNIKEIEVASGNENYLSESGVLYNKNRSEIIFCPSAVVEKLGGNIALTGGIEKIAAGAFKNCKTLTAITLPLSLKEIGDGAFAGCDNLTKTTYVSTQSNWNKVAIGKDNDSVLKNVEFLDKSDVDTLNELVQNLNLNGSLTATGVNSIVVIDNEDKTTAIEISETTKNDKTVKIKYNGTAIKYADGKYTLSFADCHKADKDTESLTENVVKTTIEYGEYTFEIKLVFSNLKDSGHQFVPGAKVEPECDKAGYTPYTCSICEKSVKRNEVQANGHTWGNWIITTAETCLEKGEETRTCAVCKATEKQEVPARGHNDRTLVTNVIPATCTSDGKTIVTCKYCNEYRVETPILSTGHIYGSWTVTVNPDCTTDGSRYRVCAACEDKQEEVLTKLGHKYQAEKVVPPTYTEAGYTIYTCSRCSDSYNDNFTAPIVLVLAVELRTEEGLDKATINKDGSVTLVAEAVDGKGNYQEGLVYSYEVLNPEIASVKVLEDGKVLVTGLTRGTTNVVCTATDKNGNYVTDTFTVEVKFTVLQWIKWFFVDLLFGFIKSI